MKQGLLDITLKLTVAVVVWIRPVKDQSSQHFSLGQLDPCVPSFNQGAIDN